MTGAGLAHRAQKDARQLDAPLRVFGHGRQGLELDDKPGSLQFDGTLEGAGNDLPVLAPDLGHRGALDSHWREGEIEFRIDQPPAQVETATGHQRIGRDAEAEFGRVGNSKPGKARHAGKSGRHRHRRPAN